MSDARIEPASRAVIVGGGSVAHIYFLIGCRNRFIVALNWAWSTITFQRGSRFITGLDAQPADKRHAPCSGQHSKAS